jgi:hypothetical protein
MAAARARGARCARGHIERSGLHPKILRVQQSHLQRLAACARSAWVQPPRHLSRCLRAAPLFTTGARRGGRGRALQHLLRLPQGQRRDPVQIRTRHGGAGGERPARGGLPRRLAFRVWVRGDGDATRPRASRLAATERAAGRVPPPFTPHPPRRAAPRRLARLAPPRSPASRGCRCMAWAIRWVPYCTPSSARATIQRSVLAG